MNASIIDCASIEESTSLPSTKRVKSANKMYKLISNHQTQEEAIQATQDHGSYSLFRQYETKAGMKCEYRCNLVKLRGPQCDSKIYLLYHANNPISLFKSFNEHNHDDIIATSNKQGIDEDTKKMIDLIIERGQSTAKQIVNQLNIEKLTNTGIQIPTLRQINNFKNNKKGKAVSSQFNFSELSNIVPDDYDEPFLVDYQIKVEVDDNGAPMNSLKTYSKVPDDEEVIQQPAKRRRTKK